MKAIITKYVGPTNFRGSRIIASDTDHNRVSIPFPYDLNNYDAHLAAAEKLCEKMHWGGKLIGGGTKTGYAFVFLPDSFYAVNPRKAVR